MRLIGCIAPLSTEFFLQECARYNFISTVRPRDFARNLHLIFKVVP
jgi:hypothetical protein